MSSIHLLAQGLREFMGIELEFVTTVEDQGIFTDGIYDLNDGTAFAIREQDAPSRRFDVRRVTTATDDVTASETDLNMAEVVNVLTFKRPLGLPTTPTARRRWFDRK